MCSLTSASILDFNSQSRILNQKLSHTFSVFSMSPNIKLDIQYITNRYSSIFSSLSWPGLGNMDHKWPWITNMEPKYPASNILVCYKIRWKGIHGAAVVY